jgi:hypothetical protein
MLGQIIALSALGAVLYAAGLAVYRAYLGPLLKVPGPKLAAITQCYEMYFDLIQKARFPWHIRELHDKYGGSAPSCQTILSHQI